MIITFLTYWEEGGWLGGISGSRTCVQSLHSTGPMGEGGPWGWGLECADVGPIERASHDRF